MLKITYSKVFHLIQDGDSWEANEIDKYTDSCSNVLDLDINNEIDIFEDQWDVKRRILEEFPDRKGFVHYYVIFSPHYQESCTMDGTEYDVENEIIEEEIHWLSENFDDDPYDDWEKEQVDKIVEKINGLMSKTNSLQRATIHNYKEILLFLLQEYPVLLKNEAPSIYRSIWLSVSLMSFSDGYYE